MNFYDDLVAIYPELVSADFNPLTGTITLNDDGDGIQYISKWEYSKPIPKGFKLGKPTK
jgi:hypothetical protein